MHGNYFRKLIAYGRLHGMPVKRKHLRVMKFLIVFKLIRTAALLLCAYFFFQ